MRLVEEKFCKHAQITGGQRSTHFKSSLNGPHILKVHQNVHSEQKSSLDSPLLFKISFECKAEFLQLPKTGLSIDDRILAIEGIFGIFETCGVNFLSEKVQIRHYSSSASSLDLCLRPFGLRR